MPLHEPFVVVDFETASKCNLKKTGAWRYAEDPSTEVLCLVFQYHDWDAAGVWTPDTEWLDAQMLHGLVEDPNCRFVAHNAGFEQAIWHHVMKRHGFAELPPERWHDTMAACAMRRLPMRLEHAAPIVTGLHKTETSEGRALVNKVSRDYAKTGVLSCDADTLRRIIAYCVQDVRVTLEMHRRLGDLPEGERAVWLLDQVVNQRGVQLDLGFVGAAQAVLDCALPPLREQFRELVGCNPTQLPTFKKWLVSQDVWVDDLQKKTVDALLGVAEEDDDEDRDDDDSAGRLASVVLTGDARRALTLARLLNSSSVSKLRTMVECAGSDGRARGLLQYYGAGTGRWSGRLVQPQNFPRGDLPVGPSVVVDTIHDAARTKSTSLLEFTLEAPPMAAISAALRHTIVPKRGRYFAVGDFSQIEARIVLALAGQDDKVQLFASGAPIYANMAEQIYARKVTKADNLEEYTIGKNTVLGCGFGMGHKKFHSRYCPKQPLSFAKGVIDTYRQEWAPKVVDYWNAVDAQTDLLMWGGVEGVPVRCRDWWARWSGKATHVEFQKTAQFMKTRLPSGRWIYYFNPKCAVKEIWEDLPDGTERVKTLPDGTPMTSYDWTYCKFIGGKIIPVNMYGGLITENIVQAMARDIMVEAMHKCKAEGLDIVLTVHDEIVCETDRQDGDDVLKQIMSEVPAWAERLGIPVAAETWLGDRYRK